MAVRQSPWSGKPIDNSRATYGSFFKNPPMPAGTPQGVAGGYQNLGNQYGQYINQINNQPLPADTSGYSRQLASSYNQSMPEMQSLYAMLGGYANDMARQQEAYAQRMAALNDPNIGRRQLAELKRLMQAPPRRSQAVYLAGY